MTYYDFFVVGREEPDINKSDSVVEKIIVEKLSYETNTWGVRMVGDRAWPGLDTYLDKAGVDDEQIGAVIEQLEALPYRAKHAYAVGREGRILIEQRN